MPEPTLVVLREEFAFLEEELMTATTMSGSTRFPNERVGRKKRNRHLRERDRRRARSSNKGEDRDGRKS